VTTTTYTSADLDLPEATPADLAGGSPAENAALIYRIFRGEAGHKRNIVLVNAAAALLAAGQVADMRAGIQQAALSIDSGSALEKLNALRKMTHAMVNQNT
jgi:anthranilate phosphoribosyltransferase